MKYSKFGFDLLKVGDSTEPKNLTRVTAIARAWRYNKKNGVIIEANGRDGAMVFTRKK